MAMNAGDTHRSKRNKATRRGPRFAPPGSGSRAVLAAAVAVVAPALTGGTAWAQTDGSAGGVLTGGGILSILFNTGALVQPNSTSTPPTLVDFTNTAFSYIRNPYISVVQGVDGSYNVTYGGNYTENHMVGGMLAFGNNAGSLRTSGDDKQALVGINIGDILFNGVNVGYGVWPLASHYLIGTGFQFADYPSYMRVLIDGQNGTSTGNGTGNGTGTGTTATLVPIVGTGNAPQIGREPIFYNGVLSSSFQLPNNILIRQEIRLYRSLAQLRWVVVNNDTTGHRVQMRFTTNVRAQINQRLQLGGQTVFRAGYFYESPIGGISTGALDVGSGTATTAIPDQFAIYGARYQPEDATFPGFSSSNPPFAARFIMRGFGATPPNKLTIRDSFEMRPESTTSLNGVAAFDNVPEVPTVGISLAVSQFWDNQLAAGQASSPIILYYGNGAATEQIDSDLVIGAEALESLGYNTPTAATVGDPASSDASDPQAAASRALFPQVFPVYASVYNRVPGDPSRALNLTNARASIVLPQGLALAPPINSASTTPDVATKVIGANGNITADTDAPVSWAVRATGDIYGAVPFQVSAQTTELGARSVTRVINIPATPLRAVTAAGFQMIGFPFEFDPALSNNGDPATVLNQNGISRPTDTPVAFYRWVPDTQATAQTNEQGRYELVTQLQNGIGYMYRPNINRTIYASGVRPTAGQAAPGQTDLETVGQSQKQIILERGWNIISNPYLYDIPINFLRFVPATTTANGTIIDPSTSSAVSQSFAQAAQSNLIRPALFTYNPNTRSYDYLDDVTAPLRPWEGYWIYTNNRAVLVYTVPTRPGTVILPPFDPVTGLPGDEPATRKRATGAIASSRAFVSRPTTSNWTQQLVAVESDGKGDHATIIGVSPDAASSKSAALPKPPPPFADYVYVGIVGTNGKGRYAKDLRSPNGTKTWDVEVIADHDGPVTLKWPNVNNLPRRVGLTLTDPSTGRAISLRSVSSYTVNVRKGQATRLQFSSTSEVTTPLALSGLRTVPGAGGRATGGGHTFVFNLTRAAGVTGRVLATNGRVVATFVTGKAVTAGETRLNWNGHAQDGSAIPPGPYQLEIAARAEDGQTVVARQPLMVNQ